MPSLGKLLNLPDSAVRIILRQIGICKLSKDGNECTINRQGIEDFKGKNKFNNSNIEVTECKINQKRRYYIRLGYCELTPERIWFYCKRKEITTSPRILGGYRKAVKFISKVITNYFRTNDLVEILLDGVELSDVEATDESSCSSDDNSSSSDDSWVKIEKPTVIEIEKDASIEGTVPEPTDKPFCARYSIPVDNKIAVDRVLNELISIKKNGREFFTYNENSINKNYHHYVDVPIGSSAPTLRALTKSVCSMVKSGNNGTSTRATKVIDQLEKDKEKTYKEKKYKITPEKEP